MKKTSYTVMLCLAVLCPGVFPAVNAVARPVPPLRLISPEPTPDDVRVLRVSFYHAGSSRDYFVNDSRLVDRYELPGIELSAGMGTKAELTLRYAALMLKPQGDSFDYGTGDLTVSALYALTVNTQKMSRCSLLLVTKLPNANFLDGFGTDETDFYVVGALSKKHRGITYLLNAGLGILGNPFGDEPSQDDVFSYGMGALIPLSDRLTIGCQVSGVANSRFNNNRTVFQCGINAATPSCDLDISVGTGVNSESSEIVVSAGLTFRFGPRAAAARVATRAVPAAVVADEPDVPAVEPEPVEEAPAAAEEAPGQDGGVVSPAVGEQPAADPGVEAGITDAGAVVGSGIERATTLEEEGPSSNEP